MSSADRPRRIPFAALARPGRHRFVTALLACVLVLAQLALTIHSLHHVVADHGDRHHCPACKVADHSPAVPAAAGVIIADTIVDVESATTFETFVPRILRTALPRGPPALRS